MYLPRRPWHLGFSMLIPVVLHGQLVGHIELTSIRILATAFFISLPQTRRLDAAHGYTLSYAESSG
jgi:hypothetical protein